MTLRVPVDVNTGSLGGWGRKIAAAINQLAAAPATGSGTVTTTGSPASGNLTKFSGATSITNGNLSGDVTTSDSLVTTIGAGKVTLAMQANVATGTVFYRKTAGSGAPEVQTLATLKTDLALSQADISGLTTADSPQFAALNVGHASDTTISRVSAGVIAVEGVAILTTASTIAGRLIGRQVITATGAGTYTPTSGTASIIIEMVGGGGGGAGCANPTAGLSARSGSGGGGAYLRKRLTANFSGAAYVVGAKGTGGSAGANNGNDGADTTFTDTAGSPTAYTAGKGLGGVAAAAQNSTRAGAGGTGGTATNGDLNIPGGNAQPTMICTAAANSYSGAGGTSMYSPGAAANLQTAANAASNGNNAGGYGGGGSGAASNGTGGTAAGGNGSDGILIIWEYS